ncbi:MAG: hypothetical protein ABEL04_14590 [Salinibacter sp.]|uniref:hypothetical protein n=1 Tax=Salinibacter sp. TaxID=2065818 RepID=UPI0035D519C9
MVRLLLASVLLLGFGALATVQAQDPDEDESEERMAPGNGGAGFFAIGTHVADFGPLNDRLEEVGYPTFATETVTIGGGGYGVVADRLLLGGEGHGLLTSDQGFQGRTVSVGGGYGLFTLGYLFRPESSVRVYPQLGVGAGGIRLEIGSRGEASNFDEVLDNPNRRATLGRASLLVRLGAGLEYQFGQPGEGLFQLGLQAGYMLSALASDWQFDDTTLSGGPDATMQGPFIQLTIGGSGSESDDE